MDVNLVSAPWGRLHSNYFTDEENNAKGNHLYKAHSDSVPSPIHFVLHNSMNLVAICFESKVYF